MLNATFFVLSCFENMMLTFLVSCKLQTTRRWTIIMAISTAVVMLQLLYLLQ